MDIIIGKGGKKTIGEMGLDARLLLKRISELNVGEEVTYDVLSGTIGREVRPGNTAYPLLVSARRAAERNGIVTDVIPKVGLKRLDDKGIVESTSKLMRTVHTTSIKGGKRLARVADFDSLPAAAKTEHNLKMSLFGVLAQASSPKAEKKLATRVVKAQTFLPLSQTLEELKDI